ncbi:MAG: ABC-2 type transport system permease protein [Limisphaerales bacterium]|jgi:ABC-2 type transport system permease protein
MSYRPALNLARVFFKMFMRDRQAIFFSLFFPVIFLGVLGFVNGGDSDPVEVSIANHSNSTLAQKFVDNLAANPAFDVVQGDEPTLKSQLLAGEGTMVLVIPENFQDTDQITELVVFVDASQVRLLGLIMPTVEKALVEIERDLRNTEPMFRIKVEDVQARSQRYIDFLLPGILAFTLMQISIAGSGFNIVEYRRKGILKRLFVTPIRPRDFIAAICIARLGWCLIQLTFLLLAALFILDVSFLGSFVELYLIIVLGTIIFLCIGFCVGSLAKTQQSVAAIGNVVIFPQVFMSGVFFPIQSMPEWLQPVAQALPLSFVVDCMRGVANEGLSLLQMMPDVIGVLVWLALSFAIATKLFVWKEVVK